MNVALAHCAVIPAQEGRSDASVYTTYEQRCYGPRRRTVPPARE
jgi:hypothetical protein